MSRFAVYGSKGWIDIRDKAHVEAPDGWIVTSAMAGGPITTAEVPPAEPVKDNLVSFARAVRGVERYPITADASRQQYRAARGGLRVRHERQDRNRGLSGRVEEGSER